MQIETNDTFFRETTEDGKVALDAYFKVHEISITEVSITKDSMTGVSGTDVIITEVNEDGIIIYDTRISRKAIEDKFNYMKMIEITEEDFNVIMIDKLKKKETK